MHVWLMDDGQQNICLSHLSSMIPTTKWTMGTPPCFLIYTWNRYIPPWVPLIQAIWEDVSCLFISLHPFRGANSVARCRHDPLRSAKLRHLCSHGSFACRLRVYLFPLFLDYSYYRLHFFPLKNEIGIISYATATLPPSSQPVHHCSHGSSCCFWFLSMSFCLLSWI